MADLATTQLKLRTTPTAGVASEQSPYYRRLLSAGYKGFLQGTVGGATLYGVIGAVIGGLVALPLLFVVTPAAAFAIIPALAGLGIYKGASTFGNIGSFAAITAESAEMSEKRRYLLDRYNDLPDTPEFDEEAKQIRKLLAKEHESKSPPQMFHWRAVAVGAALGAAISALFIFTPAAALLGLHFTLPGLTGAVATGVGTALGALSGAVIGLDRYYVRNWLDKSAKIMHDTKTIEEQVAEREREVGLLGKQRGSYSVFQETAEQAIRKTIAKEPPVPHTTTASLDKMQELAAREMAITPEMIAGLPEQAAPRSDHAQRVTRHGRESHQARSPIEHATQQPAAEAARS